QEVIYIKNTHKLNYKLPAVYFDAGPVEMFLENAGFKIGQPLYGVTLFFRPRVLQHHQTVLVINIGQCERIIREMIEKGFFYIPVIQHILVVIQMILCEVGENTSHEADPMHALLMDS